MLHLQVNGLDDAVYRQIGARLRGAALGAEPAQAAVFLGARAPDAVVVHNLLANGKHVLLATDALPGLEPLFQEARNRGIQLAVANPDHYLPSRQLLHQELASGKLGEVGLLRLHRWQPPDRNQSDALTRDLDMAGWLTGKSPNLVYAVELSGDSGGRFIQVHLGFPGGGMALIDTTDRLPPGDGYSSLSVIGSSGAAYVDDQQNMQLIYRGGVPQALRTSEGAKQSALLIQTFIDALHVGRDLSATVTSWQKTLSVAAAVRQSVAARQAIPMEGR